MVAVTHMGIFSLFSTTVYPDRVRETREKLQQTVEVARGTGEARQSLRDATDELRKTVEEIDGLMRGGYSNGHHS